MQLYSITIVCLIVMLCCINYIAGGIPEDVDEKVLHAAFIPFGDVMDIQIPLDYETGWWDGENSSTSKFCCR